MKKMLCTIVGGVCLITAAHAQKASTKEAPIKDAFSHQGSGSYGMAGCGLGSLVFGDKPGMVQIVAATVNNIISPQTFAISSGTSGCGKGAQSSAAVYIETNKVALQKDAARGEGETLAGLAEIMGCSDKGAFGRQLQTAYPKVFVPGASADTMALSIESAVRCAPQA
jgi:hypothetical protein